MSEEISPPARIPPSYTKLAMRHMVKRWPLSVLHFSLTTLGLFGVLVGLAYLFR